MEHKRLGSVVQLCAQEEEETGRINRQQVFALPDVLVDLFEITLDSLSVSFSLSFFSPQVLHVDDSGDSRREIDVLPALHNLSFLGMQEPVLIVHGADCQGLLPSRESGQENACSPSQPSLAAGGLRDSSGQQVSADILPGLLGDLLLLDEKAGVLVFSVPFLPMCSVDLMLTGTATSLLS